MRRLLVLSALLLLAWDTPVLGPELQPRLQALMQTPALSRFTSANISETQLVLDGESTRLVLGPPGRNACGPFGLVSEHGLGQRELRAVCGQLDALDNPYRAARRESDAAVGSGDRWTYDEPRTHSLTMFRGAALLSLFMFFMCIGVLFRPATRRED